MKVHSGFLGRLLTIEATLSAISLFVSVVILYFLVKLYSLAGQSGWDIIKEFWWPSALFWIVWIFSTIFGIKKHSVTMLFILLISYPLLHNSIQGLSHMTGITGLFKNLVIANNTLDIVFPIINLLALVLWLSKLSFFKKK